MRLKVMLGLEYQEHLRKYLHEFGNHPIKTQTLASKDKTTKAKNKVGEETVKNQGNEGKDKRDKKEEAGPPQTWPSLFSVEDSEVK